MKLIYVFFVIAILGGMLFAQTQDWIWAKRAGGTGDDEALGISNDASGNSYVTGYFHGTAVFGSTSLVCSGYADFFVAKQNSSGNWLWAVDAAESNGDAYSYAITTDSYGNSYVTGGFSGTAVFGSTSLTAVFYDIFIAKLDTDGNWLWAVKAGGTSYDMGQGITLDSSGHILATGMFVDSATFGTTSLTGSGQNEIYVAKLDTNGNWLWAKQAGGTGFDVGRGISTDSHGNSYVTGNITNSASFGSINLVGYGSNEIFIAKLDSSGNWLWVKNAGGTDYDQGNGISTDHSGNSYIIGNFRGTAHFGSTTLTATGTGGGDEIFVAKLDSSGNWLWAKRAGGDNNDEGYAVTVDNSGNCYITGDFISGNFGSITLTSYGGYDVFVAKLDTNGNWLWAKKAGGTNFDFGYAISIGSTGAVYCAGYFSINATFGGSLFISGGGYDVFVAKISYPIPKPPQNLNVSHNGYDIRLRWDPVTQDITSQPLTPDFYFVFYNSQSAYGTYLYLDYTPGTIREYVHQFPGYYSHDDFYQVLAVKLYDNSVRTPETRLAGEKFLRERLRMGMTQTEVEEILLEYQ